MQRIRQKKHGSIRDFYAAAILTGCLTIFLCLLWVIHPDLIFGSTMDWNNQHIIFPDYFRSRFYQTGQLFPNFASAIGAGQNIYEFTYYGLFNPIFLLSYLLPFVPMMDYIQCSSILLIWGSGMLCYWFCRQHFSERIAFVCGFLYLFSAPLIYHGHRHLMFMNYLPFLFWALFAVRRCQTHHHVSISLILASICILGCSFFFAVGSFLTIFLYAWFLYLQESGLKKSFLLRILVHLFFAGMLCMCFLLPTALALLQGRSETHLDKKFWLEVFVPTVQLSYFFYQPYGVGLTITGLFALLVGCWTKKKAVRFLSVTLLLLLCLPMLLYLINGFQYLDGKAYIPLLPLAILIYGFFFQSLQTKQIPWKTILPLFVLLLASGFFFAWNMLYGSKRWIFLGLTIVETILFLCLLQPWRTLKMPNNWKRILWMACSMQLVYSFLLNVTDHTLLKQECLQQYQNADIDTLWKQTTEQDDSWYRVYNATQPYATANQTQQGTCFLSTVYASVQNKTYSNFYYHQLFNETSIRNNAAVDAVKNLAYHIWMGDKYRLDFKGKTLFGYEPKYTSGDYCIYENQYALPIGYATDRWISMDTFQQHNEAEQVLDLLSGIVLPEQVADTEMKQPKFLQTISEQEIESVLQTIEQEFPVTRNGDTLLISTEQPMTKTISLPKSCAGKLLLLSMEVDNTIVADSDDVFIMINGIKNKLTAPSWKYHNQNYHFTYLLSDVTDTLELSFSAGTYQVSNIHGYTLPETVLEQAVQQVTPLETTAEQVRGDTISGTITTEKDGWFVLSVPYDTGFTVTVDGKETAYETVNLAFLGIPLSAGTHKIVWTYHAPGAATGKKITLITAGILLLWVGLSYGIQRKQSERRTLS